MSDDKVIPFPGRVTWANLDSPGDLSKLSWVELLDKIEGYAFECDAGQLPTCAEWVELKRRLGA
jgi:hypothetical protein